MQLGSENYKTEARSTLQCCEFWLVMLYVFLIKEQGYCTVETLRRRKINDSLNSNTKTGSILELATVTPTFFSLASSIPGEQGLRLQNKPFMGYGLIIKCCVSNLCIFILCSGQNNHYDTPHSEPRWNSTPKRSGGGRAHFVRLTDSDFSLSSFYDAWLELLTGKCL